MITRRDLLLLLGYYGLMKVSADALMREQPSPVVTETKDELPPHTEALSLVWSSQKDQIKAIELQHAKREQTKQKEYVSPESRWWHDTDERRWTVSRPFGPGGLIQRICSLSNT